MLKFSILNVGHGDFIYVETPLGNNLVIDCGYDENIIPNKFLKNIKEISELHITHPHTDHFSDIIPLSKKNIKSFRCAYLNKFSDKSIGWKKQEQNIINTLRTLENNLKIDNNSIKVDNNFSHEIYYLPENEVDNKDPNTASAVTILKYGTFKIIFGGDLTSSGWEKMLLNKNFVNAIKETSVLKVSHHGRREGYFQPLFNHIKPALCIISDKPIDKSNEKTVVTSLYSQNSTGCNIVGLSNKRSVLSTRNDGSVHIQVNQEGKWWVYPNTNWK